MINSMKKTIQNLKRCLINLDICLDEMGKNLSYFCDKARINQLVTDKLVVGVKNGDGISMFGNAVFYSEKYDKPMHINAKIREFKKAMEEYMGVDVVYEDD